MRDREDVLNNSKRKLRSRAIFAHKGECMSDQKQDWEKKFDEDFEGYPFLGKAGEIQEDGLPDTYIRRDIKIFIESLLQQREQSLREEIGKLDSTEVYWSDNDAEFDLPVPVLRKNDVLATLSKEGI